MKRCLEDIQMNGLDEETELTERQHEGRTEMINHWVEGRGRGSGMRGGVGGASYLAFTIKLQVFLVQKRLESALLSLRTDSARHQIV